MFCVRKKGREIEREIEKERERETEKEGKSEGDCAWEKERIMERKNECACQCEKEYMKRPTWILPDSETSDHETIWLRICLTQNLSDSVTVRVGNLSTQNLSESETILTLTIRIRKCSLEITELEFSATVTQLRELVLQGYCGWRLIMPATIHLAPCDANPPSAFMSALWPHPR